MSDDQSYPLNDISNIKGYDPRRASQNIFIQNAFRNNVGSPVTYLCPIDNSFHHSRGKKENLHYPIDRKQVLSQTNNPDPDFFKPSKSHRNHAHKKNATVENFASYPSNMVPSTHNTDLPLYSESNTSSQKVNNSRLFRNNVQQSNEKTKPCHDERYEGASNSHEETIEHHPEDLESFALSDQNTFEDNR